MQARPASDPTSWTYQASIHGAYPAPPPGADWNQCQHQSWFFLPWHRMYLYFFERIVRAAVRAAGGPADFAAPYWNYDRPFPGNSLPRAFRTATLPDGTANPLNLVFPKRNDALMRGGQLSTLVTSPAAALAETSFSSPMTGFGGAKVGPVHFGDFANTGALESMPHNAIHNAVSGPPKPPCLGGYMADPNCAALDPIFWLHHGNIDRIWNVWLASGGGRVNPPDLPWRTQMFAFHDENGTRVTMTAAEVLDSAAQLGYVYDDVASPVMPTPRAPQPERSAAEPPAPTGPPELAAATETPLTLTGGMASVVLTSGPASAPPLPAATSAHSGRVLVTVDDIKADVNPAVVYGVYLNLPSDGAAHRHQHHIGNISLFGIEKMNERDTRHDGAPGFRHVFDATDVVRELSAQGLWDPSAVTVTFEPIEVLPPPGEEDTWDPGQTAESVAPVELGRVSLFLG